MLSKAVTTADSLDGASVKFLLSTLKSCSELAPNWAQVAKENEIKYGKNARPRFNAIIGRFGFKLEDKKIVQINQDGGEESDNAVVKPKKSAMPPTAAKPKQLAPKKKLKVDGQVDDKKVVQVKEDPEVDSDEDGDGSAETV